MMMIFAMMIFITIRISRKRDVKRIFFGDTPFHVPSAGVAPW